jgi:hypothetical protein
MERYERKNKGNPQRTSRFRSNRFAGANLMREVDV